MARKAAQKQAQTAPLEGLAIATSGRFPGTTQKELQQRISALGGSSASKVASDTSILISTAKDYENNATKVAAAADIGIPVVSLDWLDDSESSNTKADEQLYLLSAPSATAAAPSTAPAFVQYTVPIPAANNGKGKKRAESRSASPPPAQPAPQTKKRKTVDEKIKFEDVKVGDGNNAKSGLGRINVPVDEYCPTSHYLVHIDETGVIWDAALNQTNASNNNNKFYKIQVGPCRLTANAPPNVTIAPPEPERDALPDMDTLGACR